MILVDSSVWIDYLNDAPGQAADWVDARLGGDVAVTQPVTYELLAGRRPGAHTNQAERFLQNQHQIAIEPELDYRAAVDIYQAVRRTGHTVRSPNDCLIAAVALRAGVPVAHRDSDFARIAHATGLAVVDLRS